MFVQVIEGRVSDREGLRRQMEKWMTDLRPGATGFLGSTAGVTEDGRGIAFARFESAAAAKANSDRPEQGAWWKETAKCYEGDVTFADSEDIETVLGGGSNDAGFVQIMEGSITDRAKAEAMETPEMLDQLRAARPDLLGSLRVWFDDGAFVEAAYFTSEADARKGEQSSDFTGPQREYVELFGELTFTDLHEPLLD